MVAIFLFQLCYVSAQSLEQYIAEAEANNPELQAYELRYNAAVEGIDQAGALPNTSISAGYFVSEPETRTGAQKAQFTIRQMLPWFGTITARENYASSLADVEYLDLVIMKRRLRLTVSESYYQLYSMNATKKVYEENIELLGSYERLALTAVEVDQASVVDVLKLQIRQNELRQKIEMIENQIVAEQVNFNNLIHRDAASGIDIVDQLDIPTDTDSISEASLLHPELLKYDKLYESIEKLEALNQKEANPGLGIGLSYVPVAERNDVVISDNGKDIFMPVVSLSIPIFKSKYKSKTIQNSLKQEEIRSLKTERRNKLETRLNSAFQDRESARVTYELQADNLDQALNAEEILLKNYETGTVDFNDLLDLHELRLRFELAQIDSRVQYYIQSSIINYLSI